MFIISLLLETSLPNINTLIRPMRFKIAHLLHEFYSNHYLTYLSVSHALRKKIPQQTD